MFKTSKGQNPLLFQFLGGLLDKIGKGSDSVANMIPNPPGVPAPNAAMQPQPISPMTPYKPQVTPRVQQAPSVQQTQPTQGVQGFKTSPIPDDYVQLITKAAQEAGLHPAILASLLFTEHGFSRDAGINKNTDGSYDRGPAQINTKAHPEVTDQQAMDPKFAIPWAAHTLKRYIDQTGSLKNGIAAYNVGPGGATVSGKGGPLGPRGTRYVNAVKQNLDPTIIGNIGL